jgi:MFS family permease
MALTTHMGGASPSSRPERPEGFFHQWGALVVVSLATLLMLFDFMGVSVALPAIGRGTGATFAQLQWVLEAYVATLGALVLTAGYIADVVGRRPVFLTGLGVFVIGSLFAGLSTPPLMLIGGRVVQGIGGALLFSTGAVLLAETFRLKPGRAGVAIWGTVTGMAVAVSPLVGGLVTKAFGWRWLFLLNIPVALVAFAIGTVYIKEPSIALTGAVRRSRPGTVPAGEGTKDLADPPDWLGLFLFTVQPWKFHQQRHYRSVRLYGPAPGGFRGPRDAGAGASARHVSVP